MLYHPSLGRVSATPSARAGTVLTGDDRCLGPGTLENNFCFDLQILWF
jgi:hypothetical protein